MIFPEKLLPFTKKGKFLMLALDHRESFERLSGFENPSGKEKKELILFKKKIIDALSSYFSGLLIDAGYGLPAYTDLAVKKPFLLPAEKSGFRGSRKKRFNIIDRGPAGIKKSGAAGVKLLLYFNPRSKMIERQVKLAKSVLEQSREVELPLFLEIVTYDNQGNNSKEFDLIYSSLEKLLKFGVRPDVFKLPYCGSKKGSREITTLLKGTPWILLTAGEEFSIFKQQLGLAVAGGALGFLSGRSIWQDLLLLGAGERDYFLEETLIKRFKEITKIALGG
ncbi:DUF2090 domain-containing protein [Patescibacteria group bacterium]|nr:DUF2090 domain-containing protein [Patescibacteria group bacterium]